MATTSPAGDYYYNYPNPNSNVCPGCGRCRQCGQPAPQPYYPYPDQPFWYADPNGTQITSTGDTNEQIRWETASDEDLAKFEKECEIA